MKRLSIGIAFVTLILFQACNNSGKSTANTSSDSITSTDSVNAIKDTSHKMVVAPDYNDKVFMEMVASAGITQVAIGKLAQQKGQNKRIRNFGSIMIRDLVKTNDKIAVIVKNKKFPVPTSPSASDQKVIDDLSKKTGKAFDEAYANEMITDHERYIQVFQNAATNGSDPDIKAFAKQILVPLKNHLDAIVTIHESMK